MATANLTQLLLQAQNPETRAAAEQQMATMQQSSPEGYATALAVELGSADRPAQVRQLAAIILKNFLHAEEAETRQNKVAAWQAADANMKSQVRAAAMAGLQAPEKVIFLQAASLLATIACVEVPAKQWPELIPSLSKVAQDPNSPSFAKQAVLLAVGYFCEDFPQDSFLDEKISDEILTMVVQGMRPEQPDPEVRYYATKAMLNSVEFIKSNFEREHEQEFIMQMVCNACTAPDPRTRELAFEAIVQIAYYYYDKMARYMEALYHLTTKAMREEEEPIAKMALEFWSTLCEIEIEIREGDGAFKMFDFVNQALEHLSPVILEVMTKQEEVFDENDWTKAQAASACLTLIADNVQDKIVPLVMPFIKSQIESPDWHMQEAALVSFGAILEGPSQASLKALVAPALPFLLQLSNAPNHHVKDAVAWTLGRIASFHSYAITDQHLHELLRALGTLAADVPHVASHACWAIMQLARAFDEEGQSDRLSPYFSDMLSGLLTYAERPDADESNLRTQAYEAITMLLLTTPQSNLPLMEQLIPVMITRLRKTLQTPVTTADERSQVHVLVALLCGALYTITKRLGERVAVHTNELMEIYGHVFTSKDSNVVEEALMAAGSLACNAKGAFLPFLPGFMPIVLQSLINHADTASCKAAVGAVCDLSRGLGMQLQPYLAQIVQALLAGLSSNTIHASIKPKILESFGDICLGVEDHFAEHFKTVIEAEISFFVQMTEQARTNPDLVVFVFQVHEAVFEAFTGIIQGLSKQPDLFLPYVSHMSQTIDITAQTQQRPDSLTRAAIGVVGDMAQRLQGRLKGIFNMQNVQALIADGGMSEDPETRETAQWATSALQQFVG